MKKVFFLSFSFLALPFKVLASDIHITEVLFNPAGADMGAEYVVIKNIGPDAKDLTGWHLYPDGIGYFTFSSFSLGAGASVKIVLRGSGSNSAATLYHSSPATNMGNTSGSVALFSGTKHDASTLVDFMQYGRAGETWETSADEAGLWTKGDVVATSAEEEGIVLRRTSDAHAATAWQGTAEVISTPDETASTDQVSEEVTSSGGGKVSSGPTFTQKIRAFAGSDRTSIAGAEVIFSGKALDTDDAPLESQLVRYVWNFGDGSFADGKNVSHAYLYPGTYIATLMITQGEEMFQDECVIKVGGNTVVINEVVLGAQGWTELANTAAASVDLSKWRLQDASGVIFSLPQGTRIAGHGFVVLSNNTTKVGRTMTKSFPLTLYYQNEKEANIFGFQDNIPAESSASRKGNTIVVGERTPGLANAVKKAAATHKSPKSVVAPVATSTIELESEIIATTTAPIVVVELIEEVPQASVLSAAIPPPTYEMRWLLASIAAGLLAGGSMIAFVRARKLQP